jgi:hypothetical protein
MGRTTEVYTNLAILKLAPHVEVDIRSIANDCEVYFYTIFTRYGPYLSFISIWTPSTLTWSVATFYIWPI